MGPLPGVQYSSQRGSACDIRAVIAGVGMSDGVTRGETVAGGSGMCRRTICVSIVEVASVPRNVPWVGAA